MELARKKKITNQASLLRALRRCGWEGSERTLANYLRGKTVVDPRLVHVLVDALRLGERDKRVLAWAYAFGQPARGAVRTVANLVRAGACNAAPLIVLVASAWGFTLA
jgi:hypothetical protein